MNQKEFNGLFKDLIVHLYDFTVLETHPLTSMVKPPPDYRGSRGEYLRDLILEEIERFKPESKTDSLRAAEWRSYHILKFRYIDGCSMRELSQRLSLSERQLRRDNNRTLRALGASLYEKLLPREEDVSPPVDEDQEERQAFDVHLEALDLKSLIEGVIDMLDKRIAVEGYKLEVQTQGEPVRVLVDRIIARQIFITLLSYFLNFTCAGNIRLQVRIKEKMAEISLGAVLAEAWTQEDESDHLDLLEPAFFWSQRMNTIVEEHHPKLGSDGWIELTFKLPLAVRRVIMVVDDQKPTHQMFQRFLSHSAFQIVGVLDPEEVLATARELEPALIILDVMMPRVDGWEILQALKTDTITRDIPVLVCSAWEEPELAKSLGASGFLKKPVRQRDLLAALECLGL